MNKYAQSPLQDSGLFGPSPWTILILHLNLDRFGHPAPEENLMRENLMMEMGGNMIIRCMVMLMLMLMFVCAYVYG